MPEYFIYCRKSSEAEDRQVLSIKSQTRELEQLAAKLNLPVADVLTESKSALSPEKPGMSSIESKKIVGTQVKRILPSSCVHTCWPPDNLKNLLIRHRHESSPSTTISSLGSCAYQQGPR